MARGWVGDAAFALRDCDAALRLEPRNSKAMHRRVLALQELRQLRVRHGPRARLGLGIAFSAGASACALLSTLKFELGLAVPSA